MRPVTAQERVTLEATWTAFEAGALDAWLQDRRAELWATDGPPTTIFLVGAGLAGLLRRLPPGVRPTSAGLPLGTWDRSGFEPGLEGAFELARRADARRALVNEKAAQLFLYGKPILRESLLRMDRSVGPGGKVLVVNRRGESLGIGRVVRPSGDGVVIEPEVDRGWYLRKGG